MSEKIDDILSAAVASGLVPNAVAVAADENGLIYESAHGPRAVGEAEPVTTGSQFRIMSMVKIMTATAVMQLVERGNVDLDAPVADYRPEFDDVNVLEGFAGNEPVLRPPATRATVRQLLSHTSGLSYWFFNESIARWEAATGTPNISTGSAEIFAAPMVSDPGTAIEYGIGFDWLGLVVESVSGQRLDAYLWENVTGPLGMTETTFLPSQDALARCVPIHVRDADRRWQPTTIELNQKPDYLSGGSAMYSTPQDFLKFQRMLLGGGVLDGVQVLERATVQEIFSSQTGELFFPQHVKTADPTMSFDLSFGAGNKWGLGLMLNSLHTAGLRAAWSGFWAGVANTYFWVDPASRLTGALYTQALPFADPSVLQLFEDFERA
ncbi:MAG: methyl acetate hydrolase, partial [Kribbellaceae bacterium]|nr:methyl acetate hydrolase [Kribbellaceae bacterium]